MPTTTLYLGPAGTFTGQAAGILCPGSVLTPVPKLSEIFRAVAETGTAAVVPLENSTEGAVNESLDLLLKEESAVITKLLSMPIKHCLMANVPSGLTAGFDGIAVVMAHPQALAQCREFLQKNLPDALLTPCTSNAEAAAKVSESANAAAIGPRAAAQLYNLAVLREGIQDQSQNRTAFIRLGRRPARKLFPKKGCRTSIVFSTENKPGTLCKALQCFDEHGINLTKILSRPKPQSPGAYIFYADIEGYEEQSAQQALAQIEADSLLYKFLGTYEVVNL